ncbi:response regulator [Aliamphritea spongicola]|nr:response regulator [Aliamphritea spongicola]
MHIATMLWVDLRNQSNQSCLSSSFEDICQTLTIKQSSTGPRFLNTTEADLICFEYDYPDIQSLHLLQQTRQSDPDIPILMFTEQHSEALAVWAFRTGVWDYHVKPLSEVDMAHITESLKTASEFRDAIKLRHVSCESEPLPEEVRFRAPTSGETILQGRLTTFRTIILKNTGNRYG